LPAWRKNTIHDGHFVAASSTMRTRVKYLCLTAGLALGIPAGAEQWFTVAGADTDATGSMVEVDLDSVHARGSSGEAVIRVSHNVLKQHSAGFSYRSFVASAQFDCQRQNIRLNSATYYALPAGQGSRLGADNSGRQAGMPPALLHSIPEAARRALLKATCATRTSPT
jgi:hypothetical protein